MPRSTTYLDTQLTVQAGVPLRVAVYDRIADGIKSGKLALGEPLPGEGELSRQLGVSRTVAREALLLLEEDGLVRNRRGVGRFVTSRLPQIGLERIQPPEAFLSVASSVRFVRTKMEIELASAWVREGLNLREGDNSWIWESIVSDGDRHIGVTQEHVPVGSRLADVDEALADAIDAVPANGHSLLRVIMESLPERLGPAVAQVSASRIGSTRAAILGVKRDDPGLVITQRVDYKGRPLYLGKHVLLAEAAQIAVMQS